jgi:hypothetical protein
MQFLPWDGDSFSGVQILHAPRYLLVPSLLDRLIRQLQAIQQSVRQCSALVNREGQRPLQKIRNLWTHRIIPPVLSVP